MVEAGIHVFENGALLCAPGKLHCSIPVASLQSNEHFDTAVPIGPRFKLKVAGGLFELSQQDRRKSTGPIVEIPGIESERGCALAGGFLEQSAVAKNIGHTKVCARTLRAFSEKVAGKVISLVQFSFLYMR